MNKVTTNLWDAAEHLETKEDMAAYLEAALEDGDPNLVVAALGDIARSKGMTHIQIRAMKSKIIKISKDRIQYGRLSSKMCKV